mmetsp:Transcript_18718/g.58621  ORF Transcript_18718/g.58621 Transcript_18718/m.58621 type:complete len:214 (-) Transcript_18718:5-646(-)
MPRLLAAFVGEAPLDGFPTPSSASSTGTRRARVDVAGGELVAPWTGARCSRSWRGQAAASFLKADQSSEARAAQTEAEVSREAIEEAHEQAEEAIEQAEAAEEAEWGVLAVNATATATLIGIAIAMYVMYKRWFKHKQDLLRCFSAAGGVMPGRLQAAGGRGSPLPPAAVPTVLPAAAVPGVPPPTAAPGAGPPPSGSAPSRQQDGSPASPGP